MVGGEEGPSSIVGGQDNTKRKYPVGFRFQPRDEEMMEFYLLPKLQDKPIVPNDVIIEDDVYSCDPEILTQKYADKGEDTWFFLSPRTRKYQNGDRPSRRTADDRGRWKPSTGKSKKSSVPNDEEGLMETGENEEEEEEDGEKVCSNGAIKFCVNTLAYHQGPASKEKKTKWLMREYTLPEYEIEANPDGANMMLDRYAMCKIYISPMKKWRTVKKEETGTASEEAAAAAVPLMLEIDEGTTAPPTPSKGQAAGNKRPAAEQQPLGRAAAANKRARHPAPSKVQPAPTGGGPVVGAPLGGGGYIAPGGQQAPTMPWPPVTGNRLQRPLQISRPTYRHNAQRVTSNRQQGPVRLSQPMYQHNGQPLAAAYGMAGSSLRPPVSAAQNSLGWAMMMRPPPSPGSGSQQKIGPNMAAATVMRPPTSSGFQQRMMPPQNRSNMADPVMRAPPSYGFQQQMMRPNMAAGQTLPPPSSSGSQQQMVHTQSVPNMLAFQILALPPPPAPATPHRLQKMDMNDPEERMVMAQLIDEVRKPESLHLLDSCKVPREKLMELDLLPPPPTSDAGANHTATESSTAPCAQHSA